MNTEDMLAIQQEVARYSYTFDSGDAESWANLFTDDGLWEMYPIGATEPATRLQGHAELRAFAEDRYAGRPENLTSYHHQSGVIFDELTGDTASVRTMLVLTVKPDGEPVRILMTGVYTDEWLKTSKGWRLKYRVLRP